MIVNGKCVNYDLSRFSNCKLKSAAICDLMQIPEFVAALESENEFDISDAWIARIAFELRQMYATPKSIGDSMTNSERSRRIHCQNIARHVVQKCRKMGLYEA